MAIPSSGAISLNTIQTEFGGSNPIGLNEYYAGGGLVPSGTSGTNGAVPSSGTISIANFYGTSAAAPPGQIAYTSGGTYTWVAPAAVTGVSVVVVGGGGGGNRFQGGFGGRLSYVNNTPVTAGASYTVVVGGTVFGSTNYPLPCGSPSYFNTVGTVYARGGNVSSGPANVGSGGCGGNGGDGGGGGGAGGYSGAGGNGGVFSSPGCAGAGGGGGGGGSGVVDFCNFVFHAAGGGGGVGILGQGPNGTGGAGGSSPPRGLGGGGGSSGSAGFAGTCINSPGGGLGGPGGAYGGGGGSAYNSDFVTNKTGGNGTGGAVRIIWPGNTRSFPSTNTGNL